MMVSNRTSFFGVLLWQWQHTLVFIAGGVAAWVGHDLLGWEHLRLPAPPASIIGAALGISPLTVKNHTQKIFRKLKVQNRAHAVSRGISLRVLDFGEG